MSDNICLLLIISDRILLVVVLPTPVWCNFCTTAKLSKFGRDLRCGSIVAGGDLDTHNDVADDKEVLVGVGDDVLEINFFFHLLVQIFLFLLWKKSIWKVLIIQTKMDKVIEVIISDTFSTTYESIRLNFVELLANNQHASTVYAQYIYSNNCQTGTLKNKTIDVMSWAILISQ